MQRFSKRNIAQEKVFSLRVGCINFMAQETETRLTTYQHQHEVKKISFLSVKIIAQCLLAYLL